MRRSVKAAPSRVAFQRRTVSHKTGVVAAIERSSRNHRLAVPDAGGRPRLTDRSRPHNAGRCCNLPPILVGSGVFLSFPRSRESKSRKPPSGARHSRTERIGSGTAASLCGKPTAFRGTRCDSRLCASRGSASRCALGGLLTIARNRDSLSWAAKLRRGTRVHEQSGLGAPCACFFRRQKPSPSEPSASSPSVPGSGVAVFGASAAVVCPASIDCPATVS